jgi:hypothetical protein
MAISSWLLRTFLAITVGVMLFGASPLPAQVDTGSILGTVTDDSKAIIRDASVHADERRHERQSDDHGWTGWHVQVHSCQNREL